MSRPWHGGCLHWACISILTLSALLTFRCLMCQMSWWDIYIICIYNTTTCQTINTQNNMWTLQNIKLPLFIFSHLGLIPYSNIEHNLLKLLYLNNDSVSPLPTVYCCRSYRLTKYTPSLLVSFDLLQLFNMGKVNKFSTGSFFTTPDWPHSRKGEGKTQQASREADSTCAPPSTKCCKSTAMLRRRCPVHSVH